MNKQLFQAAPSWEILSADRLMVLCFAAFPLFALIWRGWINACLLISLLLSVYVLLRRGRKQAGVVSAEGTQLWVRIFSLALAAPVAAVFLGQLFRREFVWSYYDSASKFLFAIPLLLVILRRRINVIRLLEYAVPAAIFITGLSILIHPNLHWGPDRLTTSFVDPLTFGSICLTMALISLVSIDLQGQDPAWVRLYKLTAFVAGLYLSFLSGSRTGWLALPIVLWLWLRFKRNVPNWMIFTAVALFCGAVYFSVPIVKLRIDIGIGELLHYQWDGVNRDTSVEMRLSFYRIGWYLFCQNPLGGWGDKGFKLLLSAPELREFASDFAIGFTLNTGFHNEVITNMVRSGVWGLISSLGLFLAPLALFVQGLRSPSVVVRSHALPALGYLACVLVSGMSTEVFNLKYTASFHAMMLASFAGTLLMLMRSEHTPQNS
ncbi:MAG TPA: O-antigen ligase family protein [Burkholderiaceae bacterium]|nr:O-antigen ligase family protein [Burkholderiaceae bacterium]